MFRAKSLLLALAAVATAFAGAVLATSGADINAVVHARAAFLNAVDIKVKVDDGHQQVLHVPNARDTVMQQIVVEPRGHTGWHSHPGPAIAHWSRAASSRCIRGTIRVCRAHVPRQASSSTAARPRPPGSKPELHDRHRSLGHVSRCAVGSITQDRSGQSRELSVLRTPSRDSSISGLDGAAPRDVEDASRSSVCKPIPGSSGRSDARAVSGEPSRRSIRGRTTGTATA